MVLESGSIGSFVKDLNHVMNLAGVLPFPAQVVNSELVFGPIGTPQGPLPSMTKLFHIQNGEAQAIDQLKQPLFMEQRQTMTAAREKFSQAWGKWNINNPVPVGKRYKIGEALGDIRERVILPLEIQWMARKTAKRELSFQNALTNDSIFEAYFFSALLHFSLKDSGFRENTVVYLSKSAVYLDKMGKPAMAAVLAELSADLFASIENPDPEELNEDDVRVFVSNHNKAAAKFWFSAMKMFEEEPLSWNIAYSRGLWRAAAAEDFKSMEKFFNDTARREISSSRVLASLLRGAWACCMDIEARKFRKTTEKDWNMLEKYRQNIEVQVKNTNLANRADVSETLEHMGKTIQSWIAHNKKKRSSGL